MADASSERAVGDTPDQLSQEHHRIRDSLLGIRGARDLVELLRRLHELRSLLEAHFAGEEAAGGFFDTIRSAAPRYLGRVEELRREHRALQEEIGRLMEQAHACLEGPIAEILRQAGRFAQRLSDHEAHENRLLVDAMYTDTGESG